MSASNILSFMTRRVLIFSAPLIILLSLSPPALSQQKLYWTSDYFVKRANLDGTGLDTVHTVPVGAGQPGLLALSVQSGGIFWSNNPTQLIRKTNLDGTCHKFLHIGLSGVLGVEVAHLMKKVYWVQSVNFIKRSNLDGSEAEVILAGSGGLSSPFDLVIEEETGSIFWTSSGSKSIRKATLEGANMQILVTNQVAPKGIDLGPGKIYWIDGTSVKRSNRNGAIIETIVTGLTNPTGIVVDTANGHVYWTESAEIGRANLDGSNRVVFLSGQPTAVGIGIVDRVRPAPPAGLAAEAESGSVRLKWSANCENNISEYRIYRYTDDEFPQAAVVNSVLPPDSTALDTGVLPGVSYYYWITAVDAESAESYPGGPETITMPTSVGETHVGLARFRLHHNYPNPFNSSTTISFEISVATDVVLTIFDISGRVVRKLTQGVRSPGVHHVLWDGKNYGGVEVASGLYFYRLVAGNSEKVRKMLLLK